MKYYIGDKIKIRKEFNLELAGSIKKKKYCGNEAYVIEVIDETTYKLDIDNGKYWWDEEEVEPIEFIVPKIFEVNIYEKHTYHVMSCNSEDAVGEAMLQHNNVLDVCRIEIGKVY